ncbi:iron ABC transporter ATP-binding protein [Actinomarinicola tropica]|uniref:ATP-binding cassette domain-containing protein n=1 Tax=Actinomarinicola tropica TaxID=2789776 RepID=A0A5Q2RK28_9ACTN|nr:ATP-binding cassette domain-containing protein [Actinomarinicola tropica]QGG94407.1 ATP-binding cassette domain-containing protein [Actinomarinicola tropica]
MITIDGITKRYGSTTVVDRVSLEIPRGGVVSLIGANGAGKSTLLSMVGRLLAPDGGRVLLDGVDVLATPSAELSCRLSILRQENHLPIRLTVRELVEFGRYPHCKGRLQEDDHRQVDLAIEHLELGTFAGRRLDQLSGGQRQRAYIAMVLAQDTDFVLLDEPLNNLDLRHAAQSMETIRSMAEQLDKTVVVVLHDVNVAAHHSDRVIAMKDGQVIADGAPAEVVTEAVLRKVYDLDVPVAHVDAGPVALHFARMASPAAE